MLASARVDESQRAAGWHYGPEGALQGYHRAPSHRPPAPPRHTRSGSRVGWCLLGELSPSCAWQSRRGGAVGWPTCHRESLPCPRAVDEGVFAGPGRNTSPAISSMSSCSRQERGERESFQCPRAVDECVEGVLVCLGGICTSRSAAAAIS